LALEDFTTYTKEDPNNRFVQITPTKVDVDGMTNDEDTWLTFDKGANHFGATFEHTVEITPRAYTEGYSSGSFWSVTNSLNDYQAWWNANAQACFIYTAYFTKWYFELRSAEVSSNDNSYGVFQVGNNVKTYVTIERTSETAMEARLYSDAARTVLEDTLAVSVANGRRFRYINAVTSVDNNKPGRAVSMDVENIDLNEGPVGTPMHYFARRRAG